MNTVRLFRFGWAVLILLSASVSCRQEQVEQPEAGPRQTDQAAAQKPAPVQETQPALAAPELNGNWDNVVKDRLKNLIVEYGRGGKSHDPSQPPVVVFDYDNTCIRGDIGRAFYDYMANQRLFRFTEAIFRALPEDKRQAIQKTWVNLTNLPQDQQAGSTLAMRFRKLMHQAYWSLCSDPDSDKCFPWQVRFYAGYAPEELANLAEKVLAMEQTRPLGSEQIRESEDDPSPAITSTGIRVYPEIHDLMETLHQRGFELWIVTAGPQWVVQGAARSLPVPPDHVLGMRTQLKDGKLTTQMDSPTPFREGKVQAIQKFIGRKPLLAVGDSRSDEQMLSYAMNALLIDRGYSQLKKRAEEAGWWVQPSFSVR